MRATSSSRARRRAWAWPASRPASSPPGTCSRRGSRASAGCARPCRPRRAESTDVLGDDEIHAIAREIFEAERTRTWIEPVSDRYDASIDDAYRIALAVATLKQA